MSDIREKHAAGSRDSARSAGGRTHEVADAVPRGAPCGGALDARSWGGNPRRSPYGGEAPGTEVISTISWPAIELRRQEKKQSEKLNGGQYTQVASAADAVDHPQGSVLSQRF